MVNKRILLVYNSYLPVLRGVPLAHANFCHFLKELDDSVAELTVWGMHSVEPAKNLHATAGGLPVTDFCDRYESFPLPRGYSRILRPFVLFKIVFSILKRIRRYDFIYVFFPGRMPELVCQAAILMRRKFALYVRGDQIYLPWHPLILRRAEFILATGATLTAVVQKYCSASEEVVPMCEVFDREGHSVRSHSRDMPLTGLLVGRIGREKGIFELVEGLESLQKKGIDFHFTIVGEITPEAMERLRISPVFPQLRLTGAITDRGRLEEEYCNADYFCLPTYSEGFPRVLYEALAHGLPVLTTLVGSIGGVFEDRKNCLAFPPRDAEKLGTALLEIHQSDQLRTSLAERSMETFRVLKKRFEHNSHAKQVLKKIENGI